ncbi:hypothetical protein LTS10_008380 [Elasticomyces elasticus]|nr:hypothetical protein LTS10_008380 [Elasticomyces elasticus]
MTGPSYAFGPVHLLMSMADDVRDPTRSLPIAIGIQQVGNVVSLFAFYITAGYTVSDWSSLLETTYPSPIGALFESVTHSQGATIALLAIILVCGFIGNVSYVAATLRLMHGYAETEALPYKKFLTRWDKKQEIPINLLFIEVGVILLMGCLYLGSSLGLTVIISAAYVFLQLGYITILVAYVATRGRHLSSGGWLRLPRAVSYPAAIFSLLYQVFTLVLYCLPPIYPVNVENMNWGVVFAVAGVILLSISWHFRKDVFIAYPESLMAQHVESPDSREASISGPETSGKAGLENLSFAPTVVLSKA